MIFQVRKISNWFWLAFIIIIIIWFPNIIYPGKHFFLLTKLLFRADESFGRKQKFATNPFCVIGSRRSYWAHQTFTMFRNVLYPWKLAALGNPKLFRLSIMTGFEMEKVTKMHFMLNQLLFQNPGAVKDLEQLSCACPKDIFLNIWHQKRTKQDWSYRH